MSAGEINITVTGLEEAQRMTGNFLSKAKLLIANKVAARAGQQALQKYHRTKGRALWTSTAGPTHGPGRHSTGWYKQVAEAWRTGLVNEKGSQIVNDAPYFAHKVTGGIIRPKRVRFLTIPLIPEAHGKTAKQYEQETGERLFTIKGIGILFARDKKGNRSFLNRTYGKRKDGSRVQVSARGHLSAVFALKRFVNQKPTKGALPDPAVYVGPYEAALVNSILDS